MQYFNREYWNKHIYLEKDLKNVSEETAHLATLKSKSI